MTIVKNLKLYLINVSTSYLPFLIQILGALFFTPFFIKVLGVEQYALFVIVNTVIGYFSLCDIGFSQAFTYKMIDYLQKKENKKIDALVSSVFYYFVFAGVAINALVAIFFSSDMAIHFFDPKLYPLFKIGLLTLSLSFLTILLSQFFERILFAKNQIYKMNLIKSLQQLTLILLNIILLIFSENLIPIFFSYLAVNTTFCFIMYVVSKKAHPYAIRYSLVSKNTFFSIANSSWWFFIGTVSYLLNFQTDVFVVTTLFDLKMVALYTIYYKFIYMFMMILVKPVETFIPNITAKYSKQDFRNIQSNHRTMWGFIAIASLLMSIALLKPGYLFLQWWIGIEVVNDHALFIPFVLYFVLFSIDNVSSTFLYAMCLHKKSVLMGLVKGALNLVLSVCFSKFLGISGVIWGSIASLLLTNFWYNLYLLKTSIGHKQPQLQMAGSS
jgi:O-antigen/teichoic acid export membrane protein